MKKGIFILYALFASLPLFAQEPLYIVNGEQRQEIASIAPNQIECVERLPADEETIALYGPAASNGVLLITLCHDRDAEFPGEFSFDDYIASQVEWDATEPAARIVLRYTIASDGHTIVEKELESTDSRLKRRVLKAVADAPLWYPATKSGTPVESGGVLRIELPKGKAMPRSVELVWR